jgi:3-oxoacyl-[acyl-carrier-protein] synthase-1
MSGSSENKTVYIRGAGIVSALGATQLQVAEACRDNLITTQPLAAPQVSDSPIAYYSIGTHIHPAQTHRLYEFMDYAVGKAIDDAGLSTAALANAAVFCGSTACDISDLEEHYAAALAKDPNAMPLYRSGFGVLAGYARDKFDLGGEEYSFNTACSSSANAFMAAANMIATGRCDHALVLGVEVLNQMSLQGFAGMMLLSPDACRPFDANRSGTLLGEAVACVVLSREPHQGSAFCGEKPYYFLGGANLCDTKSVTSSNADVISEVMQRALNQANLAPSDIDVIKAHGTGTENNDAAESRAMQQVFADQLPPFTSLKPYLGHTLGACGMAEMGVLLASVQQGFIPKTPTFEDADPELGVEPLREHHEFRQGTLMLNYFGFGGNNTSLILSNR